MTAHDFLLIEGANGRRTVLNKQHIVSLQEEGTEIYIMMVNGKELTLSDAKLDDLFDAITAIDYEAD